MHQVILGYLMELQIAPDVKQVGSSLAVDVSDILAIKVRAQRTYNVFPQMVRFTKLPEKAFQKSPYKSLDNEKKSWQDANDYCSQIWTGATLAIFPNQFYQSFATSLMTYYTEKPWIGLVNEAQDRNFHWVRTVQFMQRATHIYFR